MLDKSELTFPVIEEQNLSDAEIARFDALADQWWDPNGKYKTALAFNHARMSYIIPAIKKHFGIAANDDFGHTSMTIMDVGCGGGLISEPLAKLGALVTGIDASGVSIQVARQHAAGQDLHIDYRHCLTNDLDPSHQQYDVVINAEVVEHVPDQEQLIKECCQLVKPGGLLFLATLNRTWLSWLVAIIGAEYVLRLLPIGTHTWKKFVKPAELKGWSEKSGFSALDGVGMSLNPLTGKWQQGRSMQVNYMLCLSAPAEA